MNDWTRICLFFLAAIIKSVHHTYDRQEYGIGQQEMYVQCTRYVTH